MTTGLRTSGPAAGAALLLLTAASPGPLPAVRSLQEPGRATDPTGLLLAVVSLVAWALALWLLLTVVLVLAGRARGRRGRAAAALARRVAPAAVRRGVELALGLTVTLSPLAAAPAAASVAGTEPGPAAAGRAEEPAPDLDWPTVPGPAADPPTAPSVSPPNRRAGPGPEPTATVVVRPGDTLWALAEASLQRTGTRRPTDGQVAVAWPLWWSENRHVIGPDPDLIRPGTALRVPPTDAVRPS